MNKIILNLKYWFIVCFLSIVSFAFSQEVDSEDNWDNQAYFGNKLAWGNNQWRFSGEIQIRLKDNLQSLDRWFVEGIASYLLSKEIEIVPDLRLTVKPDKVEIRPGLGMYYKLYKNETQFVNQLKWQIDMDGAGNNNNAVRYALFINKQIKNKVLLNFTAGLLYRWKEDFRGIEFIRTGPGITYVFSNQHTINFNYYLSIDNDGSNWHWAGIPAIQLIININKDFKDFKYLPAKYFTF